jgi:hypothetical protein
MERLGRGVSEGLRKRWGESVPESVCRGVGRGVHEGVHCTETMERWGARRYRKVGRASAKGYMERGTGEQGFGSGSGLDPDSIGPVDPDPDSESGSGFRRAKM